jgi:hypothetical protein
MAAVGMGAPPGDGGDTPIEAPVERVDHRVDEDDVWERRLARTCAGCGCKTVGDDRRCTKCGTIKPVPTRGDGR